MIVNIDKKLKVPGIYKITYDNDKIYIGQALNIYNRALEHNSKNKQVCDRALKKHQATIEVLEEVQNIDQMLDRENFWIDTYDATNKEIGYNILRIGNVAAKAGVENPNASIDNQQLIEIVDLLQEHLELSYIDIAKKYSVSPATIYKICKGITYVNPALNYPLRTSWSQESQRKNSITDYFSSQEKLIELKEELRFNWEMSVEELSTKYKVPLRIVRDINQGRLFAEVGQYIYPLRESNMRNRKKFTQNDILNILNDLRNTTLSMTAIGQKYNIYRNTVSDINKGLNYPIPDYNYPARDQNQTKKVYAQRKPKSGRAVKCLNTETIFETITQAAQWCGITLSGIRDCANKRQKSAGKHPVTQEKLYWEWVN